MSYPFEQEVASLKAEVLGDMLKPSGLENELRRQLEEAKAAKERIAEYMSKQLKAREEEVETLAKMLQTANQNPPSSQHALHLDLDPKPNTGYMYISPENLHTLSTMALFNEIERLRLRKDQWNATDVTRYEIIVDLLADRGVILALV